MSNETKIGLFAVITIAIFIFGYKFLKGQNILTSSKLIYVEYDQVNQLASSAPVFINGFQVGVVSNIYLKPEDMQTIVTVLNINRGVEIPKTATALITPSGFIGGPGIVLEFDKACSGDNCVESGDYLKGRVQGMLESYLDEDELEKYMTLLGKGVGGVVDTLNQRIADDSPNNELGRTIRALQQSVDNLQMTTGRINSMLAASAGDIKNSLANVSELTETLARNNAKIDSIMSNTADFTGQLSDMDLAKTMEGANATLEETKLAMNKLKGTLATTDETMGKVNALMTKVNNGEGTLGKLMTDEELYNNLNKTSKTITSLLGDIEDKPYRYMPLKSRKKVLKNDKKDKKLEAAEPTNNN